MTSEIFGILTAASNAQVPWIVRPRRLINSYRGSVRACYLHLQLFIDC